MNQAAVNKDDTVSADVSLAAVEQQLQTWERPTVLRLGASKAEGTFAGVGGDNGVYS